MRIVRGGQSRLGRGGLLLLGHMYVCDWVARLVVCVLERRRKMQGFVYDQGGQCRRKGTCISCTVGLL